MGVGGCVGWKREMEMEMGWKKVASAAAWNRCSQDEGKRQYEFWLPTLCNAATSWEVGEKKSKVWCGSSWLEIKGVRRPFAGVLCKTRGDALGGITISQQINVQARPPIPFSHGNPPICHACLVQSPSLPHKYSILTLGFLQGRIQCYNFIFTCQEPIKIIERNKGGKSISIQPNPASQCPPYHDQERSLIQKKTSAAPFVAHQGSQEEGEGEKTKKLIIQKPPPCQCFPLCCGPILSIRVFLPNNPSAHRMLVVVVVSLRAFPAGFPCPLPPAHT